MADVLKRIIELIRKDTFAFIWVVFIAFMVYLTFYGKTHVKDMIIISLIFLMFVLLEPLIHMSHKSSFVRFISNGNRLSKTDSQRKKHPDLKAKTNWKNEIGSTLFSA